MIKYKTTDFTIIIRNVPPLFRGDSLKYMSLITLHLHPYTYLCYHSPCPHFKTLHNFVTQHKVELRSSSKRKNINQQVLPLELLKNYQFFLCGNLWRAIYYLYIALTII